MKKFNITVWASYETEVEANSQEEAEEIAVEESPFPYADYCETEEVKQHTEPDRFSGRNL